MENYIIANCTDTGKVRSVNEDSMVTFDSPNGRVVVVCDGMGGQNAGDVASQLAVAVIQDILTDNTFASPEEAITRSIIAANLAILHKASQDESLSGMGSTCVMVIIKDGYVYYGSVGDSRIYYVANHMIRQITKDQSYVQTLVDAGQISQEAAEHHQDKNQITNALGVEGMTPPVIGQMPISPDPDSIFILCSDGLTGMINNNTLINTVMQKEVSLHERAQLLVKQANDAGGLDNITVQLIEFPSAQNVSGNFNSPHDSSNTRNAKKRTAMYVCLTVLMLAVFVGCGVYWYFNLSSSKVEPKNNVILVKPKVAQPEKDKKVVKEKKETVIVKEVKESKKANTAKSKKLTRQEAQNAIGKNLSGKGKNVKGDNIPKISTIEQNKPEEPFQKGDFSKDKY